MAGRSDPRWELWQASSVSQEYLSPAGRAAGYTLLHVPPGLHATFFDLHELLQARGALEARLPTLLQPDVRPTLDEAQDVWHAWRSWTRQVTAYLHRVTSHRPARAPETPAIFRALGGPHV